MNHSISVDITVEPGRVWSVLTDVERWPEWTASVTRLERLDDSAFIVGSKVRMKQPRLPAAVWEVTELEPERSFTWATKSAGVTTVAGHVLSPSAGADRVTVSNTIRQTGLLAPLVRLLAGGMIRRYMQMELDGLKGRCEATP